MKGLSLEEFDEDYASICTLCPEVEKKLFFPCSLKPP